MVPILVVLPPAVVDEDDLTALWPGRPILVIGKLEADIRYPSGRPLAYHSVIAHRIELMPSEDGPFAVLTPRLRPR